MLEPLSCLSVDNDNAQPYEFGDVSLVTDLSMRCERRLRWLMTTVPWTKCIECRLLVHCLSLAVAVCIINDYNKLSLFHHTLLG